MKTAQARLDAKTEKTLARLVDRMGLSLGRGQAVPSSAEK
jgi:hypothetical protein